jgi:hypothetical protein
MSFWLGSRPDGLGLVMAGRAGNGGERDLPCFIQGLRKVVCQPLVMRLCVDPQSFVPLMN